MLKRDSFVFKVAYGFKDRNIPTRTTLCRLFWQFVFGLFIAWPVIICMLTAAAIAMSIFGVLFGKRIAALKGDPERVLLTEIRHWPVKIRGRNVYPAHFIILGFVLWFFYKLPTDPISNDIRKHAPMAAAIILGMFLFFAVAFLLRKAARTETSRLVREWIRAKKERVCPIIEIE